MVLELVALTSERGGEASRALQVLKKQDEPSARNAVVVVRDRGGETFVFETGNQAAFSSWV